MHVLPFVHILMTHPKLCISNIEGPTKTAIRTSLITEHSEKQSDQVSYHIYFTIDISIAKMNAA